VVAPFRTKPTKQSSETPPLLFMIQLVSTRVTKAVFRIGAQFENCTRSFGSSTASACLSIVCEEGSRRMQRQLESVQQGHLRGEGPNYCNYDRIGRTKGSRRLVEESRQQRDVPKAPDKSPSCRMRRFGSGNITNIRSYTRNREPSCITSSKNITSEFHGARKRMSGLPPFIKTFTPLNFFSVLQVDWTTLTGCGE
jgi:hypothetical protein